MRLLFCFLFFCSSASAQSLLFPRDSAVIKEIDLPSKEPFDTSKPYAWVNSTYVYIISDKDAYDLFGYKVSAKYFKFNFADYHVLGEFKCKQCALRCHHDEGKTECHRNRCNKEWVWALRDTKKAFKDISSLAIPGRDRNDLSAFNDTVVKTTADTSRWYTTGHGDCFASFKYGMLADNYHPVLILKEWNYWGGCRAGGTKDYTISFTEPAGILHKVKRTILMDKLKE